MNASHIAPKPTQRILFTSVGNEHLPIGELARVGYWVFGPNTQYVWPSGDFHYYSDSGRKTVCNSAYSLAELSERADIVLYDPDALMDEGL